MRSYLQCSHDTCSILQLLLGSGTKGSTDMKKAGGVENILVENVTPVNGRTVLALDGQGRSGSGGDIFIAGTNPPFSLSHGPARI